MIQFTIPYPKDRKRFAQEYGLNAYYSGVHWSVRKRRAEAWHWIVLEALQRQNIRKRIFKKPVQISFFWDDRMDIDNHAFIAKCTVDALKGYLLEDDSRRYFWAVSHEFWDGGCIGVIVKESKAESPKGTTK